MEEQLLDAADAAAYLGVSRATLYAYVSRGLVVSEPDPRHPRAHRYPRVALERFREGRRRRAGRVAGARGSLYWGLPVVDSALTLVDGGRYFHRGHDAIALAHEGDLAAVAGLLWAGDPAAGTELLAGTPSCEPHPVPPDIGAALLRALSADAGGAITVGAPRRAVLRHAAALTARTFATAGAHGDGTLPARLARGWGRPDAATQLATALVLCADHELNASAFVARAVAATDARLEHVLVAALAALHGRRHGGSSRLVADLVDDAAATDPARAVERALLLRGDLAGFGHPLYPDGDPRAVVLLELADTAAPGDRLRDGLLDEAAALGLRPNLDFGLAAFARAFELPTDGAFAIFALGRQIGWIAHAIEAAEDGRLMRPRARYTGPLPRGVDPGAPG